MIRAALAVIGGAALLAWPALFNGYPIVFSDTGAFLFQALRPFMVWDKPFVYGPFLALSAGVSLWVPLGVQVLLASGLLWLVQGVFGRALVWRHLLTVALLAILTPAPWVASLLMPDIFAPLSVLGVFVLAWCTRWRVVVTAVTTFAIAVHLSHLVLAAFCIAAVAVLRRQWRAVLWAGAPLAAAMALLVATSAIGHGRFGISPFGSVFMVARLAGDGLVEPVLAARCPQAGWRLCAWQGRLPADSDEFLWSETGPVWSTPGGPIAFATEASAISRAAVLAQPMAAARIAGRNALRQLTLIRVGDTLGPEHLDATVGLRLREYFPPSEQRRFAASLQARGLLRDAAAPLVVWRPLVLGLAVIGAFGTLLVALRRRDALLGGFTALMLIGCVANAAATGALSKPHHRYQARIAWLLLLPPAFMPWPKARRAPGPLAPIGRR